MLLQVHPFFERTVKDTEKLFIKKIWEIWLGWGRNIPTASGVTGSGVTCGEGGGDLYIRDGSNWVIKWYIIHIEY